MKKPQEGLSRIILLGGSSEIGLAILEHTCATGAAISLVGRPSPRQSAIADRLRGRGHTVTEVPYETTMTFSQTQEVLLQAKNSLGDPQIPVSAVIMAIGTMGETGTPEVTLTTNLTGPTLLILASQWILTSQSSGTLIVLSSAAAIRPRNDILFYAMAKQGIDTLVRTTARSLKAQGVKTLLIRPGFVSTTMTSHLNPPPFATTSWDIGHQTAKALKRGRTIIWVPGIMRWIILGLKALPPSITPLSLR